MSKTELIRINTNNIEAAAGEILGFLEGKSKGNVIYFHGWDGLGASTVLRLVAQHLELSKGLNKFDKVIHLDCSLWKNRRALQKIVVEELKLPQSVIDMFDRCEEDDDFNGVDQGSRRELAEVWEHIFRRLANSKFVVIFHNGNSGYVDLSEFGIPVYPHYLSNKMVWTFHGRSHSYVESDAEKVLKLVGNTSFALYCFLRMERNTLGSTMWGIMHEEAKDVAKCIDMPEYINHKIVEDCFLYMQPLQEMEGIDWETHASNYWLCDGIVQDDTSTWEIGDAMSKYIYLDWNCHKNWTGNISFSTNHHLQREVPRQPLVLCSSSSPKITNVPPEVTSFFVADTILPTSMFQHSSRSISLRVLHLSYCTINFASPPFLCCSNLRFMLLDHCKDMDDHTNVLDEGRRRHSQSESWRACFQRLWVLDLRYTDLYQLLSEEMMSSMADLRELNVMGVKLTGKHWSITDMCGCGTSLVKLRVIVDTVEDEEKNNGCVGLQQVIPGVLPPPVESFTFVNNVVAADKISSISLRGCTKLKSILLGGLLGNLEELDLSGTAVKTLDLREVEAPNLKRLILLGCEKLCAILWPPEYSRKHVLEVVRINTIRSASPSQGNLEEKTKEASSSARSSYGYNWQIAVRDARLLRSLWPAPRLDRFFSSRVCMEMDSSPSSTVAVGKNEVAPGIRSLQQPDNYLYARDVAFEGHLQAGSGNEGAISWRWDCPPSRNGGPLDRYVHTR